MSSTGLNWKSFENNIHVNRKPILLSRFAASKSTERATEGDDRLSLIAVTENNGSELEDFYYMLLLYKCPAVITKKLKNRKSFKHFSEHF